MGTWAYLFLAFTFTVASASSKTSTSIVQEYINRQRREIKVQIAKSHSPDPPLAAASNYDVRWNRLWEKPENSDHALALSISSETFVLAGDHVLRVELDVSDKVTLREVALISQQKSAKFVRTTVWKESLYLLVCQEDGLCTLHVGQNVNQLLHRQIIKHRGLPMDAEFFTQRNQLYLIVADNSGRFSVPSVIYHWTGTYMDVIAEVSTTGAVSVATFNQKHSTVIIFAQNIQGRPKIGSEVFRFENGVVEKTQFLSTDGPVSLHLYESYKNIFLLVINELNTNEIFWWDGKEFLRWEALPEIKSPTKLEIIYVDGDTLLLVSAQNILSLYRMMYNYYFKLNLLELNDTYTIMDFNARVNGTSITLVLVTKSEGNFYHVEPIELVVRKKTIENPPQEVNGTVQYLNELEELLKARMPAIEKARDSWPSLLPASENVVVSSPLAFDDIVMDAGTILSLVISSPGDILTPTELASGLEQISLSADSLISQSNEFIFPNHTTEVIGTVFVEGDAYLDELHLDSLSVNVLNGQDVKFDGILTYTGDQEFSDPLRGNNITVQNLEIDSLCGIPFKNWKITDNADQTVLDFFADSVNVLNDTVLIQSDLSLENLGVSKLNNLDLQAFGADLFIVGLNQEIKGNIFYKQGLNADNININTINGLSANELLTKTTDQQLGDFSVKTLDIDDLYVEKINNVSVDRAARLSQENVVSGQVTIRDLLITEELLDEGVSVLFDLRPTQLYSTVTIYGDLVIRNLDTLPSSSIYLNGSKVDVDSLFENYWTRSTNQTILRDVTLAGGITIDDLQVDYLNGYAEDDFLYTTATEIPEKFGPLHFERFLIDGLLTTEGRDPAVSAASEDEIVVNQRIEITDFKAVNLNAKTYNKIHVADVASGKVGVKIPGTVRYENLIVEKEITVDELSIKFLNNRELNSFFEEALRVDDNYELDYLELDRLETNDLKVEEINGLKMIEFYRMLKYKDITAIKNVTVDGDLVVSGDLQVDFINDVNSEDYVRILSNSDIVLSGQEMFKRLVVFGNLNANLLHGIKIEDLAANTLSKTKAQRITGQYSFLKVQTDHLSVQEINGRDVTSLKLVTDPLIFEGDVTFSDLFVEGDITTGYFNGQDIAEIYDEALTVPFSRIKSLLVIGNISWENSAMESDSLSYMLENSVTKNTNQTISGEVTFSDCVSTLRLNCGENVIKDVDIPGIVMDAVIPIGQPTEIRGRKVLAKGLTAGRLSVRGDIDILDVNRFDILDLNSTIVRKFDTQTIHGATIFREDVTAERLYVEGKVHGLTTQGIATFKNRLPSNTRFTNLKIQKALSITKLDGTDFDPFVRNRVTINGNHDVHNDIWFRDPVVVTQNAVLPSINGINVSDVVLSGAEEAQVISGQKTFRRGLSVHGNVRVSLMNGIGITEEHQNGIFNNEDIHINGNIIFSADFETLSNVTVSGAVNGIKNLSEFSKDKLIEASTMIENLERSQSSIDRMIDRSLNHTKSMPDVFFYLEEEQELVIRAPNIRRIKAVKVESMTKLNLYGLERGGSCGLPSFCPCPTQYVAEILDHECKMWKVPGYRTIYNVHDSEGRFGVNIISNSTSTGLLCTQENSGTELTSISWITPGELPTGHIGGEVRNESLEIRGHLSDVASFTIGAKLYIVLAIYYDATLKSHDVSSLVYEIDLTSNEIRLSQSIGTAGAVGLDVFATESHGMHLLVACAGPDYPAESQLHRFNMRSSTFELLRTFPTGGSLNAKSLIQGKDSFVLLDDPMANCVHIFKYRIERDNYYLQQTLYLESVVKNIQVFYSGEFGVSDAYVIVTTEEGRFFVYEYMFLGGFQLRAEQWLDGVQTMAPFQFSGRRYIFAGTLTDSAVYRIVQQGPNYL